MSSSLKVAVLLEDGQSVATLGDQLRLSFLDVRGLPPVEVRAWVIDAGEFGEVLVTRAELERIAIAVAAAQVVGPEESAAAARGIWAIGPSYRALTNAEWAGFASSGGVDLYSVVDVLGGWENVAYSIIPPGVPAPRGDELLELVIQAADSFAAEGVAGGAA